MGQAKANRRAREAPHVHRADGGCCWIQCVALLDWHPRDADLRGDTAECELRAGHDGSHRATLEWS
jgi:hypothetical protein